MSRQQERDDFKHEIAMDNIDRHFANMKESKETIEVNRPSNVKRYQIDLKCFNVTMNTWNDMTQRYSDCVMWRKGLTIIFEGSQQDFDKLHDELLSDESNIKVIGIHEWNLPEPFEVANN